MWSRSLEEKAPNSRVREEFTKEASFGSYQINRNMRQRTGIRICFVGNTLQVRAQGVRLSI